MQRLLRKCDVYRHVAVGSGSMQRGVLSVVRVLPRHKRQTWRSRYVYGKDWFELTAVAGLSECERMHP